MSSLKERYLSSCLGVAESFDRSGVVGCGWTIGGVDIRVDGPAACWSGAEGGQGRPEAARRGSLDGPVSGGVDNGGRTAVRGSWVPGSLGQVGCASGGGWSERGGPTSGPGPMPGAAARCSGAGHPYASVEASMKWCGRSQAGSIKWAAVE